MTNCGQKWSDLGPVNRLLPLDFLGFLLLVCVRVWQCPQCVVKLICFICLENWHRPTGESRFGGRKGSRPDIGGKVLTWGHVLGLNHQAPSLPSCWPWPILSCPVSAARKPSQAAEGPRMLPPRPDSWILPPSSFVLRPSTFHLHQHAPAKPISPLLPLLGKIFVHSGWFRMLKLTI